MARALPFIDYSRGRLSVKCPDCEETLMATLKIHVPSPRGGGFAPEIRSDFIEHTCSR